MAKKTGYKKTGFDKVVVKGSLEIDTSKPLNVSEIEEYVKRMNRTGQPFAYILTENKYKSILRASKQFAMKKAAYHLNFYFPLQTFYFSLITSFLVNRSLSRSQYSTLILIISFTELNNVNQFTVFELNKFASTFNISLPSTFKKFVDEGYLIRLSRQQYKVGSNLNSFKVETSQKMSAYYNQFIDNLENYIDSQ